MFSFDALVTYNLGWTQTNKESLPAAAIEEISHAEVTQADYGLSVCFFLKGGGRKFIPLSQNSSLKLGDAVDAANGSVITLERKGDNPIYRWQEN